MREIKRLLKKHKWLYIPLILLVLYIIKHIKKGVFTAGIMSANISNNPQVQQTTQTLNNSGISPQRAKVLMEITEKIYAAFYKVWFGMAEDEEAAAAAFNDCLSVPEAVGVATLYKVSFNKSLYNDIDKFTKAPLGIHAPSWYKFNSIYLNAIKNL